ncbi:TetR/AcrR family transcriptional regulator [Leucobacter sp. CSA2]|uniref:TetR/AcrR family transcriptional regulator n=1 Tax=Leucobacter edaphi TaxID=2796472 RepID=A0A934UXH5_9MICO|nr:TetR/AcrR family transcriptional regulator [Leucobacter edaphi]MBK0422779.1 TetR/AcrR family transcriptional regulator [Leucobacter edaphi]
MVSSPSDARRQEIIQAVWVLIAGGGIERVTFRRVADQAGVSVGRVQHHFGTRDALVLAACETMIDLAHDRYQDLPEAPEERLRHILLHAIPDSDRARFGASVWHAYLSKSAADEEIAGLLAEAKRGTEEEIARLLEDAGGRGDKLLADGSLRAARTLLAIADGLTVRVLIGDLSGAEARGLLLAELRRVRGSTDQGNSP